MVLVSLVSSTIQTARPRQWVKNIGLFLPLFFNGQAFQLPALVQTGLAVVAFCFLSASNYLINDVIDAARDRTHPVKKFRPIARRELTEVYAVIVACVLAIIGLLLCLRVGGSGMVGIGILFLLLHYSMFAIFRFIPILDVLAIALGYIIRVWAGEIASGYHLSIWLFLSILSLSMLLAIGKRRAEFSYVETVPKGKTVLDSNRGFLYSEKLLDAFVAMFANASFITYAYYAFLASPDVSGFLFPERTMSFPFMERKWMMITIIPVLYGIMRYLQVIYSVRTGVLEKAVTGDRPLIAAGILWFVSVFVVVYGIGG